MKFNGVEIKIANQEMTTIGEPEELEDLKVPALADSVESYLLSVSGQPLEFARLLIDDRRIGLMDTVTVNPTTITTAISNLSVNIALAEEI